MILIEVLINTNQVSTTHMRKNALDHQIQTDIDTAQDYTPMLCFQPSTP